MVDLARRGSSMSSAQNMRPSASAMPGGKRGGHAFTEQKAQHRRFAECMLAAQFEYESLGWHYAGMSRMSRQHTIQERDAQSRRS